MGPVYTLWTKLSKTKMQFPFVTTIELQFCKWFFNSQFNISCKTKSLENLNKDIRIFKSTFLIA